MTKRKLQLGEHIKQIGGREYVYSRAQRKGDTKVSTKYERQVDVRQIPKTMEHLSKKDKGIIERAFRKGVAVGTIQDHVWHALGDRVAASTIYAYMKRHGIPRTKRDVRIDKGKEKIVISIRTRKDILAAWHRGDSWREIQGMIQRDSGKKVGRSTIFAYMRLHGTTSKRKAGIGKR